MRDRNRREGHEADLIRHEEELRVARDAHDAATLRAHKYVDDVPAEAEGVRAVEQAKIDRVPATEEDSGEIETLPDGSVSVPVFEERLVVSKEQFVRERVIIRKATVTRHEVIRDTVRRERVEIEEAKNPPRESSPPPEAGEGPPP